MIHIPDGYSQFYMVDGFCCLYRPLLSHQRAALRREMRDLPDLLFRLMVTQTINSRILVSDWSSMDNLPDDTIWDLFVHVTGTGRDDDELADAQNLYRSACLAFEYPHLAATSCEQCQFWWYDPLAGTVARRGKTPLKRPTGGILLCQTPRGCPKGSKDNPVEFTKKNALAFRHWQLAGGSGCPDDEIVRRNWTIIARAKEHVHFKRSQRLRSHSQAHG